MNKFYKKVALILGIISIIIGMFGCSNQASNNSSEKENTVKFSTLTQEEKQSYIEKCLYQKYSCEYEISTVIKPQADPYRNTDYYTAEATAKKSGEKFAVWVDDKGTLIDSAFMIRFKGEIDEYFSETLKSDFPSCCVFTQTYFSDTLAHNWNESDDVLEFLKTENVRTDVYVLVSTTDTINQMKCDLIAERFNGCEGSLLFYIYDEPQLIDEKMVSRSDFSYISTMRKDE